MRVLPLLFACLAFPALAADGVVDIADAGPATVCFTTGNHSTAGGDCAALVVAEVGKAQKELLVQAYNFTSAPIIQAIIDAHKRGVAVTVIVDKISASQKGEGVNPVHDAGIPTYVDRKPAIAHNKVMVIDGAVVLTGSYNWSFGAQARNAENLISLRSPDLATAYRDNFTRRLAVSEPYQKAAE